MWTNYLKNIYNVFHFLAKVEGLYFCQKCAPLQVFLKDFAQSFSYLLRFLNIFEASIYKNNFWLAASSHSNQFPKYLYLQKLYVQGRRLAVEKTSDTASRWNLVVLIRQIKKSSSAAGRTRRQLDNTSTCSYVLFNI